MPKPPADPAGIRVAIVELKDSLYRTHSIHRSPLSPGPAGLNRFDAPDGSYQVLYLARDEFCAFIETFTHTAGTRIVTTAALKAKALSELKPKRVLRLINLSESGSLVRIGADARLFSGEYVDSQ